MAADVLNKFKKEMEEQYGSNFLFKEIRDGKKIQLILMTKALRQKLQGQLKEKENIEILSLEESEGEELVINASTVDMFTQKDQNHQKLADQLIPEERFRGIKDAGHGTWMPIVVHHDFEDQVPKELGWIVYDVNKVEPTTSGKLKSEAKNLNLDEFYSLIDEYLSKNSGITYMLGGKTKQLGFDCSGFSQTIIRKTRGVWLPRLSRWQALVGQEIGLAEIKIGDLVYFDNPFEGKVTHIGVVYKVKPGKLPIIVHCPQRANGIILEDLNEAFWLETELKMGGFRRI